MLKSVSAPETITQQVYKRLKSQIVRGSIPPNGRFLIADLAKDFGVSLTPIRESLRFLERDGLVRSLPHRGAVVTRLTQSNCEDLFAVRRVLECMAVRLACLHAKESQLNRIKAVVQSMAKAVVAENDEAYRNSDIAFHRTMAAASGNKLLHQMVDGLSVRFQAFLSLTMRTFRLASEGLEEHSAIAQTICDRDPERAERAILYHLDRSLERTIQGADIDR